MKFAIALTLLSAAAVKCWAIAILWGAVGPVATIVVAWMAFGTWLAFSGAGIASGLRSFVGEFNVTLAVCGIIAVFNCYVLWYGLSCESRELAWLAAFFLVIGVGCWVAIRVSERRQEAIPTS